MQIALSWIYTQLQAPTAPLRDALPLQEAFKEHVIITLAGVVQWIEHRPVD